MNPNSSLASSRYTSHYCHLTRKEVICIRRQNGTYAKFYFNDLHGCFEKQTCIHCIGNVTEMDLYPLYSVWCEDLTKYVTFVENGQNEMIEQYVFHPEFCGFEQVNRPEFHYDPKKCTESDILFIVKGTPTDGVIVIQREENGYFKKQQFCMIRQQFIQLQPVTVKTLYSSGIGMPLQNTHPSDLNNQKAHSRVDPSLKSTQPKNSKNLSHLGSIMEQWRSGEIDPKIGGGAQSRNSIDLVIDSVLSSTKGASVHANKSETISHIPTKKARHEEKEEEDDDIQILKMVKASDTKSSEIQIIDEKECKGNMEPIEFMVKEAYLRWLKRNEDNKNEEEKKRIKQELVLYNQPGYKWSENVDEEKRIMEFFTKLETPQKLEVLENIKKSVGNPEKRVKPTKSVMEMKKKVEEIIEKMRRQYELDVNNSKGQNTQHSDYKEESREEQEEEDQTDNEYSIASVQSVSSVTSTSTDYELINDFGSMEVEEHE